MKSYAAFISHASHENRLAICLKDWIETTFAGHIGVFVSSDARDIRAGDKWFSEIEKAMNATKVQLVICSPYSLTRPWIHFESGCAWTRKIPIIPLCHSGVKKDALPSPLSTFQALDLVNGFAERLIKGLADHFQVGKLPRISYKEMDTELLATAASLSQISKRSVSKKTAPKNLDQLQTSILVILAQNDGDRVPADYLAKELHIPLTKLIHFADELKGSDFVHSRIIKGNGAKEYGILPKGRAYVVDNDLV
jgi:hypothetical protein